ncbi:hypothetical protein [Spirosoma sordidisoli]|uniref:Uncharacterized protein n=1 Tax=Spirosoma sordidisoli TaxID=2502893 RepID=A0A4Q2UGU8_9BACT|nr:hypothetical protein [Spirosoma sordidisoli]RYC66500.1 hypothetical protein EQG79_29455 [Spirosoma sordidisoli]
MKRQWRVGLCCLTGWGLLALSTALAQNSVPGTGDLRTGPATQRDLEQAIDQLLGENEQAIMSGLTDPGMDWGSILVEKLLDEVYKGVAEATVFSVPAVKIMEMRNKQKQEALTKELRKLTVLMKDGVERTNKLRYQNLKLRVAYQKAMNELPTGWEQNGRMPDAQKVMKALYGNTVNLINDYYGKAEIEKLLKDQYPGEVGYALFATSAGGLADTKTLEAKLALAKKGGRLTYLSPYERLELIRETRREALKRQNGLIRMRQDLNGALNHQHKRTTEQKLRQSLGTTSY